MILQIGPKGGKSWLLRVQINGRRRDIGLGLIDDVSLRAAREATAEMRKLARSGLEQRRKKVISKIS